MPNIGPIADSVPGTVIASARDNDSVSSSRGRVVHRYASAAEGNAACPSPIFGMERWLENEDRREWYDGNVWQRAVIYPPVTHQLGGGGGVNVGGNTVLCEMPWPDPGWPYVVSFSVIARVDVASGSWELWVDKGTATPALYKSALPVGIHPTLTPHGVLAVTTGAGNLRSVLVGSGAATFYADSTVNSIGVVLIPAA